MLHIVDTHKKNINITAQIAIKRQKLPTTEKLFQLFYNAIINKLHINSSTPAPPSPPLDVYLNRCSLINVSGGLIIL